MAHGQFAGFKGLGVRLSSVDTVAQNELGVRVIDAHGGEHVYVQASAAVTAGAAVIIEADFNVSEAAVGEYIFGVSPQALALDEFGWVQVRGEVVDAQVSTGVAAGDGLAHEATTAGELSTVSAVDLPPVVGVALTAEASNLADVYLF